jgi:DNA-binding NarL/FixJ family response regulator
MKPSLLLIEDDADYRRLIQDVIGDQYEVRTAGTIAEGLKEMGEHCDLVLLDLSLPDSDREATLARVLAEHPDKPPIIVTGHDDPTFLGRMIAMGARGYIVKGRHDQSPEMLLSRLSLIRQHGETVRKLEQAKEILTETRETIQTEFLQRPPTTDHGPRTNE